MSALHSLTALSTDPDSTVAPSGEKATLVTEHEGLREDMLALLEQQTAPRGASIHLFQHVGPDPNDGRGRAENRRDDAVQDTLGATAPARARGERGLRGTMHSAGRS